MSMLMLIDYSIDFDKHGEHLPTVNVFFARLTFPFSIKLLLISSFRFLFLLKVAIKLQTMKCSANIKYIPVLSNNVANVWQEGVIS